MNRLNLEDIENIFDTFQRCNPHPRSELHYTNHFTLLVAVILSAQATDKGVNKVTQHLFQHIQKPGDVVNMGEDALRQSIRTIGLYQTKAKNIVQMSKMLMNDHGGQVPQSLADLIKLPGVGRKTANVVLNTAFGQPTIAVDTHVFRVANRLGLSDGRTPEAVEQDLIRGISQPWKQHAHHWLILHGRYICTARSPKCTECPVKSWCLYIH